MGVVIAVPAVPPMVMRRIEMDLEVPGEMQKMSVAEAAGTRATEVAV
jgi:hypothetical protein